MAIRNKNNNNNDDDDGNVENEKARKNIQLKQSSQGN